MLIILNDLPFHDQYLPNLENNKKTKTGEFHFEFPAAYRYTG